MENGDDEWRGERGEKRENNWRVTACENSRRSGERDGELGGSERGRKTWNNVKSALGGKKK